MTELRASARKTTIQRKARLISNAHPDTVRAAPRRAFPPSGAIGTFLKYDINSIL
jgi:hypothetical protein